MEETLEEQYLRVFNHFDENKDGKISASELQQCVGCISGPGGEITLEEAESAVKMMDSDGDGMVCFEDFVKLVEGCGEDEKDVHLREAFKIYEMEGSGCITPNSLKMTLSRLGQTKSVSECELMIASFDLNGDGVLHLDEFRVMMSS